MNECHKYILYITYFINKVTVVTTFINWSNGIYVLIWLFKFELKERINTDFTVQPLIANLILYESVSNNVTLEQILDGSTAEPD